MAVKNFVFRENWVGCVVAGMNIAFLSFLTQPGPTVHPKKAQVWNSLNNFIFNQLERQKLYYYQLSDIKTHESKNLENNQFLLFLTQLGQAFGPHFLNM